MGARDKLKVVRQDPRWPEAHVRLLKLWDRRPENMTQEQFGAEYDLGTQAMVWQYLNGYTPLNIEAASKFARGLRCTIKDISPEMDRIMRSQLLPAMGLSSWGKLAIILLLMLPMTPSDAALHNKNYGPSGADNMDYAQLLRWLFLLLDILIPQKEREGETWLLETT